MIYWPAKAAAEVEDFTFDFTDALDLDNSETISTRTVTVTGATKDSDSIVDVGAASSAGVKVWISAGTNGTWATVNCVVVTSGGRTFSSTAVLPIGEEPVSLAEAKAQTSMVNDDSQDDYLTSLIPSARAYVERISRYSFMPSAKEETFGSFGDFLEIHRRPVASVDTVAYVDTDGNDAEYDAFLAPLGRFPLRIYPGVGDSFPGLATGGTVTVSYTTGTVDIGSEEWLIGKRAMLLVIGDWFENRENFVLGTISNGVQFALDRLLEAMSPVSAY